MDYTNNRYRLQWEYNKWYYNKLALYSISFCWVNTELIYTTFFCSLLLGSNYRSSTNIWHGYRFIRGFVHVRQCAALVKRYWVRYCLREKNFVHSTAAHQLLKLMHVITSYIYLPTIVERNKYLISLVLYITTYLRDLKRTFLFCIYSYVCT